jgi:hypothetical protein
VVKGNRMNMADAGAKPLRKAGQLVRGNRMGMADLEGQVDQVVLAGRAHIKQGFLVVLGKVTGVSHWIARRTANTSRKVIR